MDVDRGSIVEFVKDSPIHPESLNRVVCGLISETYIEVEPLVIEE